MRNYPKEKMEVQVGFAHNIQKYQRQKTQSEMYVKGKQKEQPKRKSIPNKAIIVIPPR